MKDETQEGDDEQPYIHFNPGWTTKNFWRTAGLDRGDNDIVDSALAATAGGREEEWRGWVVGWSSHSSRVCRCLLCRAGGEQSRMDGKRKTRERGTSGWKVLEELMSSIEREKKRRAVETSKDLAMKRRRWGESRKRETADSPNPSSVKLAGLVKLKEGREENEEGRDEREEDREKY
ncbi:hypothetical protein BLNAU_11043 [Blattamonas nauphoetae]|uniref:Uncharacterized protein n=1 Tax=Blattamonas nauphoetae TaxID=2049346 RepID=A0ABQ9XPH3_9EUKA|nr:hypothetical protein BLNAU_11043 [Blattamonas nauphoetae]